MPCMYENIKIVVASVSSNGTYNFVPSVCLEVVENFCSCLCVWSYASGEIGKALIQGLGY